ncbi:MAG: zinc ribbon domain-containing protein [Terriglobales bacterium]
MRYCSNCGAAASSAANFCQQCGQALEEKPAPPPHPRRDR